MEDVYYNEESINCALQAANETDVNKNPWIYISCLFGPQTQELPVTIMVTVINAIIFVTGLLGNIAVCVVIIKQPMLHTATNYYLFNLAVSDVTLLVFGMTALCILLRRLIYPSRLYDLQNFFGWSSQSLSQIINTTVAIIDAQHANLLINLNNLTWLDQERMRSYAQSIHNRGGAIDNCWAFIDGTKRAMCRPSVNQEEYYSGHKKFHCLLYQSVLCPDGIIASLKGALPGRRHDAAMFRESGLYQEAVFNNEQFVIFGDQGYGIMDLVITPDPGAPENLAAHQVQFNQSMKDIRVAVEWGFGKIVTLFAFVDFKKNQKLLVQDLESMYRVAALLTNCHTCLYGSQAADYFNVAPPTLEEYFNLL